MMCKANYVHTSHTCTHTFKINDRHISRPCLNPHPPHSVLLLLTVMVIIVVKHLDNREEASVQQS